MPSNAALKAMNIIHKAGLALSFGRWGWVAGGMPAIKLYTTGRKSGQERESMLTCPVVQGDTFVIVASRGGDDFHPAWFLNLRDNPTVWVEAKGQPKHQRRAPSRLRTSATPCGPQSPPTTRVTPTTSREQTARSPSSSSNAPDPRLRLP